MSWESHSQTLDPLEFTLLVCVIIIKDDSEVSRFAAIGSPM